ncbi:MAG: hypothetical protein ACJAW1_003169, partial [Glaciecola sp.]
MSFLSKLLAISSLFFACSTLQSKMSDYKEGSIISGFGKYAPVESSSVGVSTILKVAFDVGKAAKTGEVNRRFDSLARFINMHVASGVPLENIELALVVHGKASLDLLDNKTYQKAYNVDNANKPLIEALLKNNVRVI